MNRKPAQRIVRALIAISMVSTPAGFIAAQRPENTVARLAAIVGFTAAEFMALNYTHHVFGLANKAELGKESYSAGNLNRSFPTFKGQGPLIDGTELRSLAIIAGLCIQNYYLLGSKNMQDGTTTVSQKDRVSRSLLATSIGGIVAWGLCFLAGHLKS